MCHIWCGSFKLLPLFIHSSMLHSLGFAIVCFFSVLLHCIFYCIGLKIPFVHLALFKIFYLKLYIKRIKRCSLRFCDISLDLCFYFKHFCWFISSFIFSGIKKKKPQNFLFFLLFYCCKYLKKKTQRNWVPPPPIECFTSPVDGFWAFRRMIPTTYILSIDISTIFSL